MEAEKVTAAQQKNTFGQWLVASLSWKRRAIEPSPREFSLLEFLMRDEGRPVSPHHHRIEQVWKLNFDSMTNVVGVYINYLSRKVNSGHDRALIRTVRGIGYQIGRNGRPV